MKAMSPSATLPELGEEGFSIASWNVLLPNSIDGWWIYKYYRKHTPDEHREWPHRRDLMRKIILDAGADIVCVQEAAAESFDDDFKFMCDAGYTYVLHGKSRFRTATFWKPARFALVSRHDKDRTIVTAFKPAHMTPKEDSAQPSGLDGCGYTVQDAARTFWVVNCHLTGGPNPDKRLRQAHDALEQIRKEITKAEAASSKEPAKKGAPPAPARLPSKIIVCGDFNSNGSTAVKQLLCMGEVPAGYAEEAYQSIVLSSKAKKQPFGPFSDAMEMTYSSLGCKAPSTFIAPMLDEVLGRELEEGEVGPSEVLCDSLTQAFESLCCGKGYMEQADVENWLVKINKKTGRGSESRSSARMMEEHPEKQLTKDGFFQVYTEELKEGKFWGVDHDMEVLGFPVVRKFEEDKKSFETIFDYIFFTQDTLGLECVRDPLTEEERVLACTKDPLPNSWQPSDHLLQSAAFRFL